MRRKTGEVVVRVVTIAILSALGFVLMAFARIPYPLAPWLMVELSDMVVLVAYSMYGLVGGISVALIKTALDLAVYGLVGLGIGNLTALFTSLMYVVGLFLTSHVLHWFKKGFKYRILAYVFITLFVAVILTSLNAIFITPSYLTVYGENAHFSTCFEEGAIENVINFFHGKNVMVGFSSYFGLISLVYLPFNLLKGSLCCVVYEIAFQRLFSIFLSRSATMRKYFSSDEKEEKHQEEQVSLEQK